MKAPIYTALIAFALFSVSADAKPHKKSMLINTAIISITQVNTMTITTFLKKKKKS